MSLHALPGYHLIALREDVQPRRTFIDPRKKVWIEEGGAEDLSKDLLAE